MDCERVAESPVVAPLALVDFSRCLEGHLNNVIEDQLLLGRVWAWDRHHDVLPLCIPRKVEDRGGSLG